MLTFLSQAAVVRGAALRGLEGLAPTKKYARRHYGVSAGKIFRENIDPEYLSYMSTYDNQKCCDGRMSWMISKVSNAPRVGNPWSHVGFRLLTPCLHREKK